MPADRNANLVGSAGGFDQPAPVDCDGVLFEHEREIVG